MKTTNALLLTCLGALACEQSRDLGMLPDGQAPADGTGVGIQNLQARVVRSYQCPAGRLSPFDETASCNCDAGPGSCDSSQIGPCLCDADCIDRRPEIACADYSLTFTIRNGGPRPVERMTEIRVTAGEMSHYVGGLSCQGSDWAIKSGSRSGILEAQLRYDDGSTYRFAEPQVDYSCALPPGESSSPRNSTGRASNDLGSPLPPAIQSGDVLLEIRGLYDDGSAWQLAASAQL